MNMEAFKEIRDAFKEVEKRVIASGDPNRRLELCHLKVDRQRRLIRTERRTLIPTNIAFVGWNASPSMPENA